MPPPKDPTKKEQWLINRSGINHPLYGTHRSEETKRKIALGNKGRTPSIEARKKMSEARKGKPHSETWCKKIGEANRKRKMSEESKRKNSESHKGEKSVRWKGGISFEPHCPRFNDEFKERVRAFFGYQCVECGTPQNGKKLAVHHANFNKKSCCDSSIPLFVSLCHPCHSKTNQKREYWEQHFTNILNQYYQGKCYFTPEEMKQWNR